MRTVRTPEKESAILDALRDRPSFASACRKARISRSIFYDWRREDPEFDKKVLEAREQGLDALEDALVTRGMKNDTTAAIFLLKAHRPDTYRDTQAVTHEGGLTIRVEYADDHAQPE